MPGFDIKNLFQLPHIIKLPELVLAFVTMVIQRAGDDGNAFHAFCGPSVDGEFFAYVVVYGFFFILLTQIIGIIFGDKPSVTNVLIGLCGFIFYLAVGINNLACGSNLELLPSAFIGYGAMCILSGLVFGIETVISALKLRKECV
jgi:hypothetical protein